MPMSDTSSGALRSGARVFGVIFQFLAFLILAGTLVGSIIVARLGQQIGFNRSNDPLVWIILASGLFATCVLAGFGYVLGMLCAIYDRQEWTRPIRPSTPRVGPLQTPSSGPTPTSPASSQAPQATPLSDRPVESPPKGSVLPSGGPSLYDNATWKWLTQERHLRKHQ
jgi:hypothetical protein